MVKDESDESNGLKSAIWGLLETLMHSQNEVINMYVEPNFNEQVNAAQTFLESNQKSVREMDENMSENHNNNHGHHGLLDSFGSDKHNAILINDDGDDDTTITTGNNDNDNDILDSSSPVAEAQSPTSMSSSHCSHGALSNTTPMVGIPVPPVRAMSDMASTMTLNSDSHSHSHSRSQANGKRRGKKRGASNGAPGGKEAKRRRKLKTDKSGSIADSNTSMDNSMGFDRHSNINGISNSSSNSSSHHGIVIPKKRGPGRPPKNKKSHHSTTPSVPGVYFVCFFTPLFPSLFFF